MKIRCVGVVVVVLVFLCVSRGICGFDSAFRQCIFCVRIYYLFYE